MPFYSKQSLLREYHRWNAPKRRNLDRYIEVIYGKTFLSELKMNLEKKRQDQSSAAQGRSQQPQKADNGSSKQEKPSDSETRNTAEDEGHLQETVTKEIPRRKRYAPLAHGSKSREEGSSSGLMTRKRCQSRWIYARDVSSSTELTGETSKNEEEVGRFQADGEKKEATTDQDIPAVMDQEEDAFIPSRSDSSTTEGTGEASKKKQAGKPQADAEGKAASTIQDNPDKGAFISTRTKRSRGIRKRNDEGKRDDTTTDGSLGAQSTQRSPDALPRGNAETATSDAPESSRAVEDKPSSEQKAITSRAQRKSSRKSNPSGNVDGTELDLPVGEAGCDIQKIQALNAGAESTMTTASESHDQFEDYQDGVLSSSQISGVTGQSALGLRGRTRNRRAFSPQQRRRVTRQRFTSSRSVFGNYKVDSRDTVTTSQPSSTSESEVKESVSDSAEGSSTALMQGGPSQETAVASKRVIRFRQTARKCFPNLSQSAAVEYGGKRSWLTDAQSFSFTPACDQRLDSASFSRRVSVEVHRLEEPVDCSPSTLTAKVDSFPKIGSQDETQAMVDVGEIAKRVEGNASSDDVSLRGQESQDPRNEDLWDLSVVSAIEDIPLLEDDDKGKSSRKETDGPRHPTKTQRDVTTGTQEWMPGGFSPQLEDLDCKPENDNDDSVIDESVEDDDSTSPIGSYLPGLSRLHGNLPTENVNSPIIPVLGLLRQPTGKEKQAEIANKTAPTTRSRSLDGRGYVFTSPTNFPVGNWKTKNRETPQEAEQTEKISPRQRRSPSGRPVATATKKDQLVDPRVRSLTTLNTGAVTSTGLAPQLPAEKRSSVKTGIKTENSLNGQTKRMDQSVAMETPVKDEMYYPHPQEEPVVVPKKIRTAAEKKHRWSNQEGNTNFPDQKKDGLKQEDQLLFSPVKFAKQVDWAIGQTGARKRKRNDSQEGQMRGHSGWEESLRQKPATVTKFQAGETHKTSKKPETEKKRWQSPAKNIIHSPTKADSDKSHLPPKSPFRDVWKPPPSKKMKLYEGSDHAHKSSEEEELSKPITTYVSTPRPPPVLQDKFRYGELIWGKMKGFNWWPGTVVHHHASGRDAAPSDACWVKWYGDDKFSKLNLSQVTPFFQFSAHFSHSTFLHTALYRRAVFLALLIASTRAGKTYSSDATQYKTEVPKRSRRSDPAWQKFYELCNEMIGWAKDGFEPGGKDAIMPDEEEQQPPPRPASPPPSPALSPPTKRPNRSPSKSSGTWKDIRDVVIPEVRNGIKCIEDICIGCGSSKVTAQHPFFIGGLCEVCRIEYAEMAYVFDEDGYQCFCCICAEGSDIILCDQPECYRSFCHDCIECLVGPGQVQTILADDQWKCYMCNPEPTAGLLTRREDWPQKLLFFFQQDHSQNFPPIRVYPPVAMDQRKPVRVLSLFDGIGTGMLVLKELGVKVDCYYASEISEEAMQVSSVRHDGVIQQLNDVRGITEQEIKSLGPFDLLIGGSPCNDLSIANPARKGLFEGTGVLFFEFYRLLTAVRPEADSQRPFFWLFENVVGMPHKHKMDISRFLQCDPVVVDAKDVSPAHRARYFWGNLPGMNRPNVATDHNALCLQDCLEPNCNRQAQFSKVRTVTSKLNSIKQKNEQVLPVLMNGQEDALWCTEMERIFGFPEHYTDIANMSRSSRHKLIGQAWSVPVIKHLLAPLKEYFACETHEERA